MNDRKSALLLRSAAVAILCASDAGYAWAQTTITTATSTPLTTSSSGDIDIQSAGSVTLEGGVGISGVTLITINSNSPSQTSVTNEAGGTISVLDYAAATAILATSSTSGPNNIYTGGTITVSDSTPATVIPLTDGYSRYAIDIAPLTGAYNGSINQAAGTITVLGNNSAAILINSGGLNGQISLSGSTAVTGDTSFGIQTLGPILNTSGEGGGISMASGSSMTIIGNHSGGISLGSTVAGQVYLDGTITTTVFYGTNTQYYTNSTLVYSSFGSIVTRPVDPPTIAPQPGSAIYGGSALAAMGSVGGGIFVDTSASLNSYGSAPTVFIAAPAGGSMEVMTGNVYYGVVNNGEIDANGIFDDFNSTAVQIGGVLGGSGGQGGTTLIDGGFNNSGTISATAYAANATAVTIQPGATVNNFVNTGTITATVNGGYGTSSLRGGSAIAVIDTSGTLNSLTNSGKISATSISGPADAISLSGSNVAVTQEAATGSTTAPSIAGDIVFGGANSTLNLQAGTLTGNTYFGTGTNNLILSGGSNMTGGLSEATGGVLNVNISDGGHLVMTNTGNVAVNTLNLGPGGEIDFAVNPATASSAGFTVSGPISAQVLSNSAKLGLDFQTKLINPETFTLVQYQQPGAGSLVSSTALLLGNVSYFYLGNILTNPTTGSVAIAVEDRPFAQAGVAGNAGSYNAAFAAFDRDSQVYQAFNSAYTQQAFSRLYNQTLPSDSSGGLFQALAQGADAIVRAQEQNPIAIKGGHSGSWSEQIGFVASDAGNGQAPGYSGGGLGLAFGWEEAESDSSALGYSASYTRASVNPSGLAGDRAVGTTYMIGTYYREAPDAHQNGVLVNSSFNIGYAGLNSERVFNAYDSSGTFFNRTADARWYGAVAQAHFALAYQESLGDGFYLRPESKADYFVLYQGSHNEHNGGSAFDLDIASSTSKQGAVEGGVTLGTEYGDKLFLWRPEVTVGYRQVFGGAANTVAQYASGGSSFTMSPLSLQGGAIARLGVHGGNQFADLGFEASGEENGQYRSADARVVARFRF